MNLEEKTGSLSAANEGEGGVMGVMEGMEPTAAEERREGEEGDAGEGEKQVLALNRSEELVRKERGRRRKRSSEKGCGEEEEGLYVSPLDYSVWVFFGGLVLVLFAAVLTRFYKISQPPHIA